MLTRTCMHDAQVKAIAERAASLQRKEEQMRQLLTAAQSDLAGEAAASNFTLSGQANPAAPKDVLQRFDEWLQSFSADAVHAQTDNMYAVLAVQIASIFDQVGTDM